jgi:hypothetical protein
MPIGFSLHTSSVRCILLASLALMWLSMSGAIKAETTISTRTDSDFLNAKSAMQTELLSIQVPAPTGTFTDAYGNSYAYTVTKPLNASPTQKYPLLVHAGDNDVIDVETGMHPMACPSSQASFPCYVVGIDASFINISLASVKVPDPSVPIAWKPVFAAALKNAVDIVRSQNSNVDDSRIYISGWSKGGGVAWVTAYTYPDTFAAIVASSATVEDMGALSTIVQHNIGVWMTQGIQSEVLGLISGPRATTAITHEMVRLGGNPKTIIYDSNMAHRHATMYDTLTTRSEWKDFTAMRTWLFAQKKSFVSLLPSITANPLNQNVNAGQTAAFWIVASGWPTPTPQWEKSTDGGATWTAVPGANTFAYTTPVTALADDKTLLRCKVNNASASATSKPALLTVNSPTVAATFSSPLNKVVKEGQTASFAVGPYYSALPRTYQWQKSVDGGRTWTNILSATSYSYTTPATILSDTESKFRCIVSTSAGTAASVPAFLEVLPIVVAPSFTLQPADQTANAGQAVTFTVSAAGAPTWYQWKKSINGGVTWLAIADANFSSYTIPAVSSADSNCQFRCVMMNMSGSATSSAATLTINGNTVAPAFTIQPQNKSIAAGQTVTFTVAVSGAPAPTIQWQKSIDGGTTWTNIVGATAATYTTAATVLADNGTKFRCVATNSAGTMNSNAATLTVAAATVPPAFIMQPQNKRVTAGQTAAFSAAASGNPSPSLQWQKSTDSGATWTNIVGGTAATYTTALTVLADNGTQFRCVATNSAGTVNSNAATLTVTAASVLPSFTTQPVNQSVTAGQTAAFTVAASGLPAPTLQWQKSTDGGATWVNIIAATTATYTMPAIVNADNGAKFRCVATNSVGPVNSNPATLTVTAASVLPSFTTQPVSQSVTAGQTAAFTVAASGVPAPTLQWQKSTDGGATWMNITGATTATYTTPSTVIADNNSKFRCVATNSVGAVNSDAATLTVNIGNRVPVISSMPMAIPNPALTGQNIVFQVAASDPDGDSMTYAWNFGDGAIANGSAAQHTYAAAGSYVATVTISDGSASISASISVTVNPATDTTLAAYWPLDESSGLVAADASGNGNNGTLVNNSIWTPAHSNGGLKFDGKSYVDCGNGLSINPANQITISAWINSSDPVLSATQEIVAKDNRLSTEYYLRIQTGGRLRFGIAATILNGTTVLAPNTWYHVAAVYDGTTMNIYINGRLDGTISKTGAMSDNGVNLRIGARQYKTTTGTIDEFFFKGVLDDVRIYSRALGAQEVQNSASQISAGAPAAAPKEATSDIIDLGTFPTKKSFKLPLRIPLAATKGMRWTLVDSQLPKGIRLSRAKIGGRTNLTGSFVFSVMITSKSSEGVVQRFSFAIQAPPPVTTAP